MVPTTLTKGVAGQLKRLLDEGKTRSVGLSNVTLRQLEEFSAKRPDQIRKAAGGWKLSEKDLANIQLALAKRGMPVVRAPD